MSDPEQGGRKRRLDESWDFLSGDLEKDRRNLRLVLDTAEELYGVLDPEERMRRAVDRAIVVTGAEQGMLFLHDGAELELRVSRDANGRDLTRRPTYSSSIVRDVWKKGAPVCVRGWASGGRFEPGKTVDREGLMLVMAARLTFDGRPLGVLYTQAPYEPLGFTKGDDRAFRGLAGLIATAVENACLGAADRGLQALKKQVGQAREVQARLRPSIQHAPEGLDVFGAGRICENLSGDYYDVIPRSGGTWALAIGDVKDHGIRPALYMTSARALLRRLMEEGEAPDEALRTVSRHLDGDMDESDFMTLFLGLYAPEDRTLRWASAGHNPPLLLRTDGRFEDLESTGPMLGLAPEKGYAVRGPITLEPGDVLLLYTDGLVEARAPEPRRELWGEERLRASLASLVAEGRDVQRIVAGLFADVDAFRAPGPLQDDITLILVRVR